MSGTETTEYRQDVGGSIATRLDDNGYLRVDGVAAKAGVMTYVQPNGEIRREYVPVETLRDADGLAMLAGSPVTVEHPPQLVDTNNASIYSKGSVSGEPRVDGGELKVGIVVTNADAIAAVQSGKRQLSPGYKVMLDFTPGEFEGAKYDAIQTKRFYNHLAIVGVARGGSECRLNLDGLNCAVEVPHPPHEAKSMATVQLKSGASVEVADASTASTIQNEINALAKRADAADEMVKKSDMDELQGKYDALLAKFKEEEEKEDEGDKEEKADADQLGAFIETVEQARKLKSDLEIKVDGKYLDATGIMAAALDIDGTDKSPEYIKGRFDSALELAAKNDIGKQREIKGDSVQHSVSAVDQYRAKFFGGKA